jgi:hypothetical protein
MESLLKPGQEYAGKVINAGYNCVLVLLQIAGLNYVFSMETFPQADLSGTEPPQDIPVADEDLPARSPKNQPTKAEATEWWTSNAENNADGTRKGGILGSANLGLAGEVFIGDTIGFNVVENTKKNAVVNITTINDCACKTIKAYACQEPSKQAVVDTPNFVSVAGNLYVFCIIRGLFSKSQGKVDYPSTPDTESVAIAGGGFVNGNQTVQQAHDAEVEEEGAKPMKPIEMQTFNLPTRTDGTEEPRYCEFSFIGADGTIKEFGMNRGRVNSIQVRFYGELSELPIMYKATDKTEVLAGFWMPVDEFLALSNDPTTQGRYAPWILHQTIARDASAEIYKSFHL